MRNQDDPQGRHFGFPLRPTETAFWIYALDQPEQVREPVLVDSQKGRRGLLLKDMECF